MTRLSPIKSKTCRQLKLIRAVIREPVDGAGSIGKKQWHLAITYSKKTAHPAALRK
jgi:hypothetical protein